MDRTTLTLQQAQEQVDEWIRTYEVRYFSELTIHIKGGVQYN